MKLDSKIFDSIRVGPTKGKGKAKAQAANGLGAAGSEAVCQWEGCTKSGPHRAPAGRNRENEFFNFCVDHIREYNKSYNYFSGLEDDDIAKIQKDNLTGGRPTWKMGTNSSASANTAPEFAQLRSGRAGYYRRIGSAAAAGVSNEMQTRKLRPLEKKAMRVMGLPDDAKPEIVRARYKDLVKQNHPDVNGGSRESEERLQEVLHAYKILKSSGLCT